MTLVCPPPDLSLGVAQRLSVYFDCQARALGENGFQALAGGTLGASILAAVTTIFIAIIGLRLILGHVPDVRDGVGWALRLGFVLALVTSWPAFQTLVYRVAVDGPQQIAALALSSAALSGDPGGYRVQVAYDQTRAGLGTEPQPPAEEGATAEPTRALLEPLPKTATLLVISTVGLTGALKLGIGLLLALSPLAFLSLLFNATAGLFNGWLRGLTGFVLALVGATLVTAADLLIVEGELSRLRTLVGAGAVPAEAQSLSTIVILFALVAFVVTLAGMWMASALTLPSMIARPLPVEVRGGTAVHRVTKVNIADHRLPERSTTAASAPGRAVVVARALSSSMHREQRTAVLQGERSADGTTSRTDGQEPAASSTERLRSAGLGVAGRRGIGRRTVSATRRDQLA